MGCVAQNEVKLEEEVQKGGAATIQSGEGSVAAWAGEGAGLSGGGGAHCAEHLADSGCYFGSRW